MFWTERCSSFQLTAGVVEEEGKAGERQGPDHGILCYPADVVDLLGGHWNYLPRLGCFPLDLKHITFVRNFSLPRNS